MKSLKVFIFFAGLYCYSGVLAQLPDTTQQVEKDRINSIEQQQKPYVILVSADGFRYDYDKKYQAAFLLSMYNRGVHAAFMQPSFPSLTFPNHYTLVTGLYPAHHGIVGNNFYDPGRQEWYTRKNKETVTDGSWYRGVPLWVLAEQQQMLSASLFWVGSEADVRGIHPSYWYRYNENMSIAQRIGAVINWLKLPVKKRPHLITFYLPEVDHAGHDYGPDALQTRDAVLFVDSAMRKLTAEVKKTGLPVNFVFVSDHGMSMVKSSVKIPAADTTRYIIENNGTMASVWLKDPSFFKEVYASLKEQKVGKYKIYKSDKTPAYWHYSAADDSAGRIADILLVPVWPRVLSDANFKPGGYHGFDPVKVKEMRAYFSAWGPAFREGLRVPAFKNVDIYPMIAEILGLKSSEPVDGKKDVLSPVLKESN